MMSFRTLCMVWTFLINTVFCCPRHVYLLNSNVHLLDMLPGDVCVSAIQVRIVQQIFYTFVVEELLTELVPGNVQYFSNFTLPRVLAKPAHLLDNIQPCRQP